MKLETWMQLPHVNEMLINMTLIGDKLYNLADEIKYLDEFKDCELTIIKLPSFTNTENEPFIAQTTSHQYVDFKYKLYLYALISNVFGHTVLIRAVAETDEFKIGHVDRNYIY